MGFKPGGLASLAQCGACDQYVYGARVDGCDTAVDITPISTALELGQAVAAGKALHGLSGAAGGLYRVSSAVGPRGYLTVALVAAHGCGSTRLKFLDQNQDPHQAPATRGSLRGGHPQLHAQDEWAQTCSPAGPANPHPGEPCTDYSIEFNGKTIWMCTHA